MSIHIKPEHEGDLHRDTGTPLNQPIPAQKLMQALHSKNPKVRKRANFAKVAKKWNHSK
jgi:hypothetical protein